MQHSNGQAASQSSRTTVYLAASNSSSDQGRRRSLGMANTPSRASSLGAKEQPKSPECRRTSASQRKRPRNSFGCSKVITVHLCLDQSPSSSTCSCTQQETPNMLYLKLGPTSAGRNSLPRRQVWSSNSLYSCLEAGMPAARASKPLAATSASRAIAAFRAKTHLGTAAAPPRLSPVPGAKAAPFPLLSWRLLRSSRSRMASSGSCTWDFRSGIGAETFVSKPPLMRSLGGGLGRISSSW
mmetsp:Transcript_33113/g.79244  ORF Transcript_33113/g.79244 Transcript_33113/m.79244 type:complete len:240 (+) Transcript_33113:497-1216(+)